MIRIVTYLVSSPASVLLFQNVDFPCPGQSLHFPSLPCHYVSRDFLYDFPSWRKDIADFEPGKAVAQFDDLGLLLVNVDTQPASYAHDFFQECFKIGLALVDRNPVIHIRIVAVNAFHCLAPRVYWCRVIRT